MNKQQNNSKTESAIFMQAMGKLYSQPAPTAHAKDKKPTASLSASLADCLKVKAIR